MPYTCDCGQSFGDLNGIEACQRGNHGKGYSCSNCKSFVSLLREIQKDVLYNYRDKGLSEMIEKRISEILS